MTLLYFTPLDSPLLPFTFRCDYLLYDVSVLSVNLSDGSEIPEDPERLVELRAGDRKWIQAE